MKKRAAYIAGAAVSALAVAGLSGLFGATYALAYTSPGSPHGYVNDFAHVLSADTVNSLNAELAAEQASTTNEVAVVTIPSLGGDYIEHYAEELFKEWGIGTKNKDNGVLLLLAIEDKKLRIEVGYGLEGTLPDSVANSIIVSTITPQLKAGDYDAAVEGGVRDILAAIAGEYEAPPQTNKKELANLIFGALFVFIFVLQWAAAVLARSKSWWAGGVVGALGAVILSSFFGLWLWWGIGITAALFLLGLLFDFTVSNAFSTAKASGIHPAWWAGGPSTGTGSGSSFGGFGGGSSGGGGASGGW